MRLLRLFSLLCLLSLAACGPSEGPREAADRFFHLCSVGKLSEAYQSASTVFRADRSEKYFEARVRDLGLASQTQIAWGELSAKGRTYTVQGSFTYPDMPGKLVLDLVFVEEGNTWRLLEAKRAAGTPGGGEDIFAPLARSTDNQQAENRAFTDIVATAVPNERQLQQLVERTLLDFSACVKAGDFSQLYDTISDRWKFRGKQPAKVGMSIYDNLPFNQSNLPKVDTNNSENRVTKAALNSAFRAFVENQVDLTPIAGKTMILDQPAAMNSDGVLVLKGRYSNFVFIGGNPPSPRKMEFKLEYVFEASQWRLFGITVNLSTE